jgi:hypothetical protein
MYSTISKNNGNKTLNKIWVSTSIFLSMLVFNVSKSRKMITPKVML